MSLHVTNGFGFGEVYQGSTARDDKQRSLPAPFVKAKKRRSERGVRPVIVRDASEAGRRNTEEFLATRKGDELSRRVIEVRNEGRWEGVPECGGYMGAAVYDIACTPENYNKKIWMADIYDDAFPWLAKGILSSPSSASDRVSWFLQMAKFISASQSSSGMKPVFMHDRVRETTGESVSSLQYRIEDGKRTRGKTRTSLTRGVGPAALGAQITNKVMLYGPSGARRIASKLWKDARRQGRRLFLPIEHSRFFAGSTGYPGQPRGTMLVATGEGSGESEAARGTVFAGDSRAIGMFGNPWDLMERGSYLHAPIRGRVTQGTLDNSWDSIGSVQVVHENDHDYGIARMFDFGLSRAAVFNAIAARNDPGEMIPLEAIFPSTRGQGADAFMVPTWSTLKKYISEWAKPLVQQIGLFVKQGWNRYLPYYESFPAENLGMTAPEHAAALRAMDSANKASASNWIGIVGGTAAGIVTAINPIAGVIVSAVVAIVALIARFVQGRIPCPPIPMPFMMRSGPPGTICDFGVTGSNPFQSAINVVLEAEKVGITLRMPEIIPETLIGPLPSGGVGGGGDDYPSETSNMPLILGGAVAAIAIVAIAMGKR